MLVEFVTVTQTLEGVSVSNKFREFSQTHTRQNEGMRKRVHAYPCLPGIIRLFIALKDISTDETTKTNRQTIEKTNMTQPAELDWSCHETTI